MGNDLYLHHLYQEKEFWNRYDNLKEVLRHLQDQNELLDRIRREEVIPEGPRELAMKALSADIGQTRRLFSEIFQNFVSGASAGLNRVDLETSLTLIDGEILEVNRCALWVDGEPWEIPADLGRKFAEHILSGGEGTRAEAIAGFYENEEHLYDMRLGGSLNRCSLQMMEEIYPARNLHVRIRLPAQSLVDHHII
ncbi:MAG: hypothetical protein LUQ23_00785 [Methanomicrobiales archaeon]|nr:hypothetical protein [Methanomicrobiales archaeon]MDD1669867.1 hypothetical protein [Methanomicrobiales archaeon]